MSPERYDQIMAAFLAASQLSADKRSAFLNAYQGDDELLREVESLLRHDESHTISTKPGVPANQDTRVDPVPRKLTTVPWVPRLPASMQRPVVAAMILVIMISGLGLWLGRRMGAILRANLADQLRTVLAANESALQEWIAEKKAEVESWASHADMGTVVAQLVELAGKHPDADALSSSAAHDELLRQLRPVYRRQGSYGIAIIDQNGVNVLSNRAPLEGLKVPPQASTYLQRVLRGYTVFAHPTLSMTHAVGFPPSAERPLMAVATPVRDRENQVIAALVFAFDSRDEFADLLTSANLGSSADTFALDANGLLLSNLKHIAGIYESGLLPLNKKPAMNLELRDPGVDLTRKRRPLPADRQWPLTAMAASVAAGRSGMNLDGYRNVLGQSVVGAWTWLPEYNFAVATEILQSEAYAPLYLVNKAFRTLLALIVLLALAIALASGSLSKAHRQLQKSSQVGPYELTSLIGQGGMGKVYLAQHALLKRPTAVKLFNGHLADRESVRRFEREVQLTSRLEHPNTIRVYDFGRTADGLFYYAMEYLDGLNLAQLVARQGPLLPARAIYLLTQVCQSLKEAHESGLIHRDIKPANIMVCRLGGLFDVVKVLDFGLVKEMAYGGSIQEEHSQQIGGTPRYIAPERFATPRTVDARSDLYSLGAVAYFLLAGREIFADQSPGSLLMRPVPSAAPRVSEVAGIHVPPPLDNLIHDCLAVDPDDRPTGVADVLRVLSSLADCYPWSADDAAKAWCDREDSQPVASS